MRAGPVLLVLLSAALFGASTPLAKILLRREVDPFVLAGLLYLGAGAGMGIFGFLPDAKRRRTPGRAQGRGAAPGRRLDRKNFARLALMVGAGGVAGPVLLMLGLKAASAGSVALWLNFEMVATLLLGILFFKESFGPAAVAGSLGAFAAGVLLVLREGPSGWASALLVLGATTAWGVDNHASALVDALSPAESTAVKGLAAGTVNVLLGLATGASLPPAGEILAALVLGFASYGLSIALYVRSAQGLGASRAQILFASSPFWGLCLAALLPGEGLGAFKLGALLLFAASAALIFADRHAHRHRHAALLHEHVHSHDDGHHDHAHEGLDPRTRHVHEHGHEELEHEHAHLPDIHHRHGHGRGDGQGGKEATA